MRGQRSVSKAYHKRKLEKLLRGSKLRDILIMVWSADAVHSGEPEHARKYLTFPQQAVAAKPGEDHFIASWALETLVNEALTHKSASAGASRILNTGRWESFTSLFNLVKEIENAESLDDIPELGILDAMPRLGWRQFKWQRGYKSAERFYRAWSLYNFPEADDYFIGNFDISVERFCYVGFALASQLTEFPAVRPDTKFEQIGITDVEKEAFLNMVSLSSIEARKRAREDRAGKGQIAYKPSVLRRSPMIVIGKGDLREAFCPLPALLNLRISDGLFYDLVGDDSLRRIIGERFEAYIAEVTRHYLGTEYQLLTEVGYGPRAKRRATPDIRIVSGKNELRVVVECKSRRIPFKVLSSPNPFLEYEDIYSELVKGVVQVWKYVSDVRRGAADNAWRMSEDSVGVVLTLEPWFEMHSGTIQKIREAAILKCAKYPEVNVYDQIRIAFVATDDWEYSIRKIDVAGFMRALNKHACPDRAGYLLSNSIKEIVGKGDVTVKPYDYHGGISRLVSWWEDIGESRMPKK